MTTNSKLRALDQDLALLSAYLALEEPGAGEAVLTHEEEDKIHDLLIRHYQWHSQSWPKQNEAQATLWTHRVILYLPRSLKKKEALLFINSGTSHPYEGKESSEPHALDFARLAADSQSLVIDLQNVPNQYLSLSEGEKPLKGDQLLVACWKRFIMDPEGQPFASLYFPMTKAVIKLMDWVQRFYPIENFVLVGMSKRALCAWFCTLLDSRVSALVSVVMDMLDGMKALQHIYQAYDQAWPPAFGAFVDHELSQGFFHPNFARLMRIEDPLSYMQAHDDYAERLSIPKYLLSASGDDLFVPDSLSLFYPRLPGETALRVMPNQSHQMDLPLMEKAVLDFYLSFLAQEKLPRIQWERDERGALARVTCDQRPKSALLWQAENKIKRDFRLAGGIRYHAYPLEAKEHVGTTHYELKLNPSSGAYLSHFVELNFENIVLTTPAYVINTSL